MDTVKNSQDLGCYQLFQTIQSVDKRHADHLLKIIKKQYAFFLVFMEEMELICSSCFDSAGEIISAPDMEKVGLWRKKLHDFYHSCLQEVFAYLETNICISKKTRKKRFLKIKKSELGDSEEELDETTNSKNNHHFYSKHVWKKKEGSNPSVIIRNFFVK